MIGGLSPSRGHGGVRRANPTITRNWWRVTSGWEIKNGPNSDPWGASRSSTPTEASRKDVR